MSILQEYNIAKHDPTKLFTMDKCRGAPYPVHVIDKFSSSDSGDTNNNSSVTFCEHSFDHIPRICHKHKKFYPTIYGPRQSSHSDVGVQIRGRFYLNEATIGALTRSGLPENYELSNDK